MYKGAVVRQQVCLTMLRLKKELEHIYFGKESPNEGVEDMTALYALLLRLMYMDKLLGTKGVGLYVKSGVDFIQKELRNSLYAVDRGYIAGYMATEAYKGCEHALQDVYEQ